MARFSGKNEPKEVLIQTSGHDKNRRTFKEVFGYNSNPNEEENKLIESCRTKEYKSSVVRHNILFKLTSTKLDSKQGELFKDVKAFPGSYNRNLAISTELKNYICFQNPFKLSVKNSKSFKSIFSDLGFPIIVYLISLYVCIKYPLMTGLQFEHDYIEHNLNVKLKDSKNGTDKCCLKEDIYLTNKDEEILARFEFVKSKLELLNDPIISFSGSATAVLGISGLIPSVVYFTSILSLCFRRNRVDVLSFYLNPFGEIFRIKKDLTCIVFRTLKSIKNYHARFKLEISSSPDEASNSKCSYTGATKDLGVSFTKEFSHSSYGNKLDVTTDLRKLSRLGINYHSSSVLNTRSIPETYTGTLFDINLVEMVKPGNLTSKWHKTLLSYDKYFFKGTVFCTLLPAFIIIILNVIGEIYKRVKQRLDSLECQKWKLEGVLIKETIKLNPLNSQEDKLAYSTYDGTTRQFIYLMMQVETKYYLSTRVVFAILEMLIVALFFASVAAFFYYLYVRSFLNRLVWLIQIQEQVNWSTNHLKSKILNYTENESNSDFDNLEISHGDDNEMYYTNSEELLMGYSTKHAYTRVVCPQNKATTLRAILITYLNYELFRKQQVEYLKLATLLLSQLIALVVTTFVFCYFIGTKMKNNLSQTYILFISTYLMAFLNLHLLIGAILISRSVELTKSILSLLAAATLNKMQLLDVVDLWRRQLQGEEGTKKNFAIKLFSVYLSYDSIISFDAYLVALWLILLNNQRVLP